MANSPKSERSNEEGKTNSCQEFSIKALTAPSNLQKIAAEFIGTFFLVFLGSGAILVSKIQPITVVGVAIVWGFVLMALIYGLGYISGAHFNPAVTIAFACAQKFPWPHVPVYVMSQMVGAAIGSLILRVLWSDQHNVTAILTLYSSPTTPLQAFIWEFFATFLLMFTISSVTTDHRASKDFAGVAIGAALLVNVVVVGPITGASLNPARSFGPAIATGTYKQLWIFIISPVLGATAASMAHRFLRVLEPQNPEPMKETDNIHPQAEP